MVHIGEKIKQRVEEMRFSVAEFAGKINKSRTVAYNIFQRKSLDTGLLIDISKALNYDFFVLFLPDTSKLSEAPAEYRRMAAKEKELQKELAACRREYAELKEKYELQKKVNTLLEEKIKKR